jgi:chromate reductase, NAD(P)H dehydrogenase (quinone)
MSQNTKKILAFSGSTKAQSINKAILNYIGNQLGNDYEMSFFDLDTLPHFNPDLDNEADLPSSVQNFRNALENADGVLICTPEYVFSLPGVLKNALEWIVSTIIFDKKPTALVVASSVGEKAFESLQLVLNTIGARIDAPSAVLLNLVKTKINENGSPKDEYTEGVLGAMIEDFKNNTKTKI